MDLDKAGLCPGPVDHHAEGFCQAMRTHHKSPHPAEEGRVLCFCFGQLFALLIDLLQCCGQCFINSHIDLMTGILAF